MSFHQMFFTYSSNGGGPVLPTTAFWATVSSIDRNYQISNNITTWSEVLGPIDTGGYGTRNY